jgi:hypothetical protein
MTKTPVTIHIREVSTGKEVSIVEEVEDRYLDTERFYYEEGNGSCDCNRKLMFGRALGIEFSDPETPCGSGKYQIRVSIGDHVILDELDS